LEKDVFELAHDEEYHGGFHRTCDRIVASVYVRHLSQHLRTYIGHCPESQLNQTKRPKPSVAYTTYALLDRFRFCYRCYDAEILSLLTLGPYSIIVSIIC